MNRRDFIKKTTLAGVAGIGVVNSLTRISSAAQNQSPELIIAQNGNPEALLQAALTAYGGLKKLIKSGGNVVIKANFSWYGPPEQACNNNPELLAALVKACKAAGAKRVRVVDLAIEPANMCLTASKIQTAVAKAGGEAVNLLSQPTVDKSYGTLDPIAVYKEALEADCLINVPILKDHSVTKMTCALKNLMGLTPERREMHALFKGIDRSIADLAHIIRPHLHIIDAYRVLKTNGPRGPGEIDTLRQVFLTHDPVVADAYGASILNVKPRFLQMAADDGLGIADLNKVSIKRVNA